MAKVRPEAEPGREERELLGPSPVRCPPSSTPGALQRRQEAWDTE